jgi:hypothetical protein
VGAHPNAYSDRTCALASPLRLPHALKGMLQRALAAGTESVAGGAHTKPSPRAPNASCTHKAHGCILSPGISIVWALKLRNPKLCSTWLACCVDVEWCGCPVQSLRQQLHQRLCLARSCQLSDVHEPGASCIAGSSCAIMGGAATRCMECSINMNHVMFRVDLRWCLNTRHNPIFNNTPHGQTPHPI